MRACAQKSRTAPSTCDEDERGHPAATGLNGLLRASINLGNPVWPPVIRRNASYGVLHRHCPCALAERLGVVVRFVVFDAASHSVDAVANDLADIGFFAIDPNVSRSIAFTDAYLHIEGWYAVHTDSPITTTREVDRPGNRVAVGRGSAYDLFPFRANSSRLPTSSAPRIRRP